MPRISCAQTLTRNRSSTIETRDIVPNKRQFAGTCPQELSQQNHPFPRWLKLVPLTSLLQIYLSPARISHCYLEVADRRCHRMQLDRSSWTKHWRVETKTVLIKKGSRLIKYFFLYFKYICLLCTCTSSTFFGKHFYFYLSSFFPCYLYFYSSSKNVYLYQHCF